MPVLLAEKIRQRLDVGDAESAQARIAGTLPPEEIAVAHRIQLAAIQCPIDGNQSAHRVPPEQACQVIIGCVCADFLEKG